MDNGNGFDTLCVADDIWLNIVIPKSLYIAKDKTRIKCLANSRSLAYLDRISKYVMEYFAEKTLIEESWIVEIFTVCFCYRYW